MNASGASSGCALDYSVAAAVVTKNIELAGGWLRIGVRQSTSPESSRRGYALPAKNFAGGTPWSRLNMAMKALTDW
jgi:hypothetical protein